MKLMFIHPIFTQIGGAERLTSDFNFDSKEDELIFVVMS